MPGSKKALAGVAVAGVVVLGGVACTSGNGHQTGAAATQSPVSVSASSPRAATTGAAVTPGAQSRSAVLCNSQQRAVDGGVYTVQNNEYDSGASECLGVATSGDFTVTRSAIANTANGTPGGYPSIYRGCHWGACTADSGLPVTASSLLSPGAVTTTWVTAQPGTGTYDVAYDIWFNKTPTTGGQPNGAELMIWLNHSGTVQPYGSQVSTASIGGRSYQVWFGNEGWNTISYSMETGTTSVQDLDIGTFVADAVRRGYIQKSWYLIDVEAGFELWQGGAGLATNSFAVNVSRG
jgi:hypothetical protein